MATVSRTYITIDMSGCLSSPFAAALSPPLAGEDEIDARPPEIGLWRLLMFS
jgi:hypothetical protein